MSLNVCFDNIFEDLELDFKMQDVKIVEKIESFIKKAI